MDSNQIFVLALANVPTILTVLIGIMLNNGRFNDLNSRMGSMEGRLNHMNGRISNIESKLDSRNRLTRIEGQRH